jgi:hypothetical protein
MNRSREKRQRKDKRRRRRALTYRAFSSMGEEQVASTYLPGTSLEKRKGRRK